jgi:hypothetical protein
LPFPACMSAKAQLGGSIEILAKIFDATMVHKG